MRFIVLLFFVITAHAQIRPADQQYIPQENLLLNPGLEQGRVNWTISGTATVSLEQTASAVLAGLSSLKIVASSQTFEVAQFTTKSASSLNGMQAMASVRVKTNQSGVQVCSIENSVHVKCVSVDSTNQAKEYIIPFVFNSTNNGIVIKGASGTGTTYIDDAYVGIMPANRMPEIQNITEWTDYGAITITATTTNPTKGTVATDNVRCREVGQDYECEYRYRQTTAGSGGSGDYIFALPSGVEFSDSIPSYTTIARMDFNSQANMSILDASGMTSANDNGGGDITGIMKYSSNSFRVVTKVSFSSAGNVSSTYNSLLSNPQSYSFNFKFRGKNLGYKSKVYSGATIYPHAQLYSSVRISGGSTVGGTNATYNEITNANWTLERLKGTSSNIACSGTEAASGTTCTGNESMGISFVADNPGEYVVCGHLPTRCSINSSGVNCEGYYKIVKTENNSQVVLDESVAATGAYFLRGSVSIDPANSRDVQICHAFTETSPGTKTYRFFKRIVSAGVSGVNYTFADASATDGKYAKFDVYYYPPKDNPIIGTFEGIEKCEDDFECTDVFSAKISSAGVVSAENLDWINGNCTNANPRVCTFNTSIFTVAPNCVAVAGTSGKIVNFNAASISSTVIGISTFNDIGGAEQVETQLICQKQGSDFKAKTAKAATTNEMMYVPNVTRPKTCYYAFGGAGSLTAPTNCTSSPCTEYYDSCSAGTAPNRTGVGLYTGAVFANGTWKPNVLIMCKTIAQTTNTGVGLVANPYFITGGDKLTTNASGGYSTNFYGYTAVGAAADSHFAIECTADAP